MNQKTNTEYVWNSYWFRLLVTQIPFMLIFGLVTWISQVIGISTAEYLVFSVSILFIYGVLFEEKYLKEWRREPVNLND